MKRIRCKVYELFLEFLLPCSTLVAVSHPAQVAYGTQKQGRAVAVGHGRQFTQFHKDLQKMRARNTIKVAESRRTFSHLYRRSSMLYLYEIFMLHRRLCVFPREYEFSHLIVVFPLLMVPLLSVSASLPFVLAHPPFPAKLSTCSPPI